MKNKQKNLPFISIVIVAGPNRKKELSNCLLSIKKSSYKNYETIVVDNSQNPKLKQKIMSSFPKIKFITMPSNLGILGYNIGIANSKGKYILTLDDDCTINKDSLQKIAQIFPQKPKKVAALSTNLYEPSTKKYVYKNYLKHKNKKLLTISNATVFKKNIFVKTNYFDQDFFLWVHEDDLAIRILDNNMEIHFEPKIIVNHHLEKNRPFRKQMAFYLSRNLAWFNIKHFNLIFFPFLALRNFATILLMPVKRKTPQALFYCLAGYIWGYLTFYIFFKKRKPVKKNLQKRFIKFYLFNKIK